MHEIPEEIRTFYESPLGRAALDLLRAHVEKLWPVLENERIFSLGAAGILFDGTVSSARMTGTEGENFSCLVDAKNKPLPDADVDRLAVLHGGASFDLGALLREGIRVLKGEGRILLILPRKGGLWDSVPLSPFGQEPAYSERNVRNLLKRNGYFIERIDRALYAPPIDAPWNLFWVPKIEMAAPFVFPFGGGVLVVEAKKREPGLVGATAQNDRETEAFAAMPMPCG